MSACNAALISSAASFGSCCGHLGLQSKQQHMQLARVYNKMNNLINRAHGAGTGAMWMELLPAIASITLLSS